MVNKKKQHFVPACYLSQWCDINTPINQEPYIWIYDKNNGTAKKKAPKNIFYEKEIYTIKTANNERNLVVEDSLSTLEDRYAIFIRNQLNFNKPIEDEDRLMLCTFMASMCIRTSRWKTNVDNFIDGIVKKVKTIESHHHINSKKSNEIERQKKYHIPINIAANLQLLTNIIWAKSLLFFKAPEGSYFITSDDPCNIVNTSLNSNFFYCSPSPGQIEAEITMALSPQYLVLAKAYIDGGWKLADKEVIFQTNMRAQLKCHKYYVAHVGDTPRLIYKKNGLSLTNQDPSLHSHKL